MYTRPVSHLELFFEKMPAWSVIHSYFGYVFVVGLHVWWRLSDVGGSASGSGTDWHRHLPQSQEEHVNAAREAGARSVRPVTGHDLLVSPRGCSAGQHGADCCR